MEKPPKMEDSIKVKLPISNQEVELHRCSWGERLEVEDLCTNVVTGKSDLRKLHAILIERSSGGVIKAEQYLSLDPTDGYLLREKMMSINAIDPDFLPQSASSVKESVE